MILTKDSDLKRRMQEKGQGNLRLSPRILCSEFLRVMMKIQLGSNLFIILCVASGGYYSVFQKYFFGITYSDAITSPLSYVISLMPLAAILYVLGRVRQQTLLLEKNNRH